MSSWLPPPACTLRLDYPLADEAAACRTLWRVRELRLDHADDLLDPGLIRFLESTHLTRLKTLDLSVPVTRRVIDGLIRLPNLAGVEDVRIVLDEDDGYDPEAECIRLRGRFPRVTVVQAAGP